MSFTDKKQPKTFRSQKTVLNTANLVYYHFLSHTRNWPPRTWVTQDGVGFLQVYRQVLNGELAPMDGIRLLRYGTLVPVIYATPSLWTILMLNSQLPHESYRVYIANIVILYNDWWQRRDLKWSLIHSYKSRLPADHGSNFGEFAYQTSKLQKSSHAHLFQVIILSRKRG